MPVKADIVNDWVDKNLPPLSWRILMMKQMKLLLQNKISPTKIDSNTLFNDEIIAALRKTIKNEYGKELPQF